MKTLLKLALIGILLGSNWSLSYSQRARLKRATSPVDTAVVVTGVETNTIVMELDEDVGATASTSGFYELYVLVTNYTANATTGRITVKPREFVRSEAGVKTFYTSLNDSINITTALTLTGNGLFNFNFAPPEAPLLSFDFVTVSGDTFSIQTWIRYLGE